MAYNVWWVGSDGNVWTRQGDRVSNAGKFIKQYGDGGQTGFDAANMSAADMDGLNWARIDDPNAPQQQRETAPVIASGTGGAAPAGPNKVLNQAAVDNTKKALSSLDDELSVGYGNIDDSYNSLLGRYNKERGRNRADYDEETVTNTTNLQKNKQNALVSAAQGLRGLRGVLSSIGALSGDGSTLANRAVTTEANQDIGGAADNFAGNARTLDKAWSRFDEEDDDRRAEARTAKENQRTALEGKIAEKRQNMYQKLAELFGEVDNTGEAKSWLDKAGDLNTTIARKSRVASTPFSARKAAFTPGELENYLAGAGDMTVEVRDGSLQAGGPNPLLAASQNEDDERRRRLATV